MTESKCKKCGQTVFVKTNQEGKQYEVNMMKWQKEGWFHSATCSGRISQATGVQTAQDKLLEEQESVADIIGTGTDYLSEPHPIRFSQEKTSIESIKLRVAMSKNYQTIEAEIIVNPGEEEGDFGDVIAKLYEGIRAEIKPRIEQLAVEMR